MSDRYLTLVNSPAGKAIASRLGLPRPAVLRRYQPASPLLPGPLLLGAATASTLDLADLLREAGADVHTEDSEDTRWGALVLDANGVVTIGDLAAVRAFLAGPLRRLLPSGRVVVLGRPPQGDDPVVDAVRQAIEGIVRSLAKELRAGATANLIVLDAGASPESALRFLLSGRSAYVDGQPIRVGTQMAPPPADWAHPLDGKVAVVTGAARGIGAAIASVLARDGARVVCVDVQAAGERLARVANRIGGVTLHLDITERDAAQQLLAFSGERFAGLDILVHNAGITRDKLLVNMAPDQWDAVLAVNLEAQLRINAALLKGDALRPSGRVVCVSSTTGLAGNRGQTNYGASKAGVIGMVRTSARLFAERDATINAVAPGFIDTEMTQRMPVATREFARRLCSLQQAGLPVDVAEAVAWLASPGAGGVNGQVLRVCGQALVGA